MPAASNVQQARRVKDFKDRSTSLRFQKAPTRPEIMLIMFPKHKEMELVGNFSLSSDIKEACSE